uniref:EF-hand domain-containing protein n=1 Tax=Rhizochromulina marina TaxID=1034831 RepID=A0A7S2S1L2_9STRA|mmetsp:Transcript_23858/g.69890  ORF Transcript_23858/g.69890 Transcript_23858/m.69890 type:complete len:801 (+) Transcript_23858:138-2540(+)
MRTQVKILVLGDDGVGKSSLICTLISNHFSEREMPAVYKDVSIPPEATEDGVQVIIMDSSQTMATEELTAKVAEADSIVLVYDIQRRDTLDHLMTFWLPFLTDRTRAPVIIAGNKSDAREVVMADAEAPRSQVEEITPILEKFRSMVWACFECSAKNHSGIAEVFWMAQIVVTHPSAPIFDLERNCLTAKCTFVMKRIFRFYDVDGDGVLNDEELREFQLQCFNTPLSDADIVALRKVISKEAAHGVVADPPGITLDGFLAIFTMFIRKHTPQAPWMVLRKFGYDDNLDLPQVVIDQFSEVPPHNPSKQVFELTNDAQDFLVHLFRRHSVHRHGQPRSASTEDSDLVLDYEAQVRIFETVPQSEPGRSVWSPGCWAEHWTLPSIPWLAPLLRMGGMHGVGSRSSSIEAGTSADHDGGARRSTDGVVEDPATPGMEPVAVREAEPIGGDLETGIGLEEWMSSWRMATCLYPTLAMRFLCYLGYNDLERTAPALRVSPAPADKRVQARSGPGGSRVVLRSPVQTLVFGKRGVGKSHLVQRLISPSGSTSFPAVATSGANPFGDRPSSSVLPVSDCKVSFHGRPAHAMGLVLTLTEVPETSAHKVVDEYMARSHCCDVALLAFDANDQESLAYILDLERRIPEGVPRVLVATKEDTCAVPLQLESPEHSSGSSEVGAGLDASQEPLTRSPWEAACTHCKTTQLLPPLPTSALTRKNVAGPGSVPERLLQAALDPMRSTPFGHAKVERKKRSWLLWIGFTGLLAAGGVASLVIFDYWPSLPVIDINIMGWHLRVGGRHIQRSTA